MKCSKCNNEISDNSIYCNLCGADQRYNKEKSKLHTQSTSTSPKIPSTIFIIRRLYILISKSLPLFTETKYPNTMDEHG